MRFFILISFSSIYLFAITFLPYDALYTKLTTADKKLQTIKNINTLENIISQYHTEMTEINKYSNLLLKEEKLAKDSAKKYLTILRKSSTTYESVLYLTKKVFKQSIINNDKDIIYKIASIDLEDFFDDPNINNQTITYYKKNKKHRYNKIMQRELDKYKAIELAKKEEEKYLAQLEAQANAKKQLALNHSQVNQSKHYKQEPLIVNNLESSKLNNSRYKQREAKFSKWFTKREHQDRFNKKYYKQVNTYPAYVELDKFGNRRILEIPYEPKFYWTTHSGVTFKYFKKRHVLYTLNGKQLLSLYIREVDGIKLYTATWVSNEYFQREANKLNYYGIDTPKT